jgi:beta-lactamase regulating signal transducer with metallopeptidase domain
MSVLILLFTALTPLLKQRFAAKWLYYAWLVLAIALIIPFRPHPEQASIRVGTPVSLLVAAHSPSINLAAANAANPYPKVSWPQLAGGLWLAGAIAVLAGHAWKYRRFVGMHEKRLMVQRPGFDCHCHALVQSRGLPDGQGDRNAVRDLLR